MTVARSRWFLIIPLTVIVALVIAACGGGDEEAPAPTQAPTLAPTATRGAVTPTPAPTPAATPTPTPVLPKRGRILRTRIEFAPTAASHWNLLRGPINSAFPLFQPVLSSLVQLNMENRQIVGDLAEGWTFSQDGKQITFKIRRGVTWHDGTPLKASDIKFTWDAVLKETGGYKSHFQALFAAADSAAAPDDSTLVLTLKRPSNSFFRSMTHGVFVLHAPHVPEADLQQGKVIGTNAFRWVRNDQNKIEERSYANYWDKGVDGKPLPYLDGIDWNVIKDSQLHLAAFRTGQLDAFDHINSGALVGQIDTIKKDIPGLIVESSADSWRMVLVKNRAPFNNINVRKAMNLGIDRQAFVDAGLLGAGTPAGYSQTPKDHGGVWSPSVADLQKIPGMNPSTRQQDLAEAERLLAAAGFTASNPAKVTMTVVAGGVFSTEAEVVVSQLNKIKGLQVDLKVEESAVHNKRLVVPGGDFDLIYRPFAQAIDDPSQTVGLFWITKGSRNYGEWSDAQIDAWYEEQESTQDQARRALLVRQIMERAYDQAYYLVLAWAVGPGVKRPDVKGLFLGGAFSNRGRYDKTWLDR